MKKILIIGLILIPSISHSYYTITGTGLNRYQAMQNTISRAHWYCLSISNGQKNYFPIDREWIYQIDKTNPMIGICSEELYGNPPVLCQMHFECLNRDIEEDNERKEEIMRDAGIL